MNFVNGVNSFLCIQKKWWQFCFFTFLPSRNMELWYCPMEIIWLGWHRITAQIRLWGFGCSDSAQLLRSTSTGLVTTSAPLHSLQNRLVCYSLSTRHHLNLKKHKHFFPNKRILITDTLFWKTKFARGKFSDTLHLYFSTCLILSHVYLCLPFLLTIRKKLQTSWSNITYVSAKIYNILFRIIYVYSDGRIDTHSKWPWTNGCRQEHDAHTGCHLRCHPLHKNKL